jgi:hypothetical protein
MPIAFIPSATGISVGSNSEYSVNVLLLYFIGEQISFSDGICSSS